MSNFKNNYSELLLLANKNIVFKDVSSGFSFEIVPMKVEDMFFNEDLNILFGILESDLINFSQSFNTEVTSYLMALTLIVTLGEKREELKSMSDSVRKALQKIIPEINFDNFLFKIEKKILTPELFDQIIEILFKILGKEKIIINELDDEFTKAEKEARLRAQKIRKKGKKESGEDSKIEDVLLALLYEYPQYKLEDLFQLNIYTFNYLFSKVGQIANYEVSKIAAGNGLTKKHKYLIGKK